MTSKEVLELYYIHLCIIQTPHGIIIYQTDHINDTILSQCFPDAIEKINSDTTPLKVDSTFELALAKKNPVFYMSCDVYMLKYPMGVNIGCYTITKCIDKGLSVKLYSH